MYCCFGAKLTFASCKCKIKQVLSYTISTINFHNMHVFIILNYVDKLYVWGVATWISTKLVIHILFIFLLHEIAFFNCATRLRTILRIDFFFRESPFWFLEL